MSFTHGDARSTRNHFREPQTVLGKVVAGSKKAADACASIVSEDYLRRRRGRPYSEETRRKAWYARLVTPVLVLQLLWVWLLYWGERSAYSHAINACDWRHWERWAPGASPHHVALIADPQLVDPHTYPGRPWPLSTLTVAYTDLYLKRVYKLMQERLYPDSTVFLGDLFDGGREWSVHSSERWDNPDKSWKGYSEQFWLKEYKRFSDIFFKYFTQAGLAPREGQQDRRRLIASLPGNHDLGFGNGVHIPVRNRFEAYFGEANRVDIIGNHSFISVDGVSFSSRDNADEHSDKIWKPSWDFLEGIQQTRRKAIAVELKKQFGVQFKKRYDHQVVGTGQLYRSKLPAIDGVYESGFPAVLLTHVPLYRDPGTPCGLKRERHPQGRDDKGRLLDKDDRNAISVVAGYQYQNVLSHDVSQDITRMIGDVRYAFSGDDHDYCEVKHMRYPSGGGGIREITVKSLSWAMGVRVPGFVTLSLWNPVDEDGLSVEGPIDTPTIQSNLCLLPDQLAIFIRYGILLVITLSVLLIRASRMASNPHESAFGTPESPILPTINPPPVDMAHEESLSSSSDDSAPTKTSHGRRSRTATLSDRSASPAAKLLGDYVNNNNHQYQDEKDAARKSASLFVDTRPSKGRRVKGLALFYAEFKWTVLRVVIVAAPWYFWLIWTG